MSKIDLHLHSSFSDDGELTPEEIVKLSLDRGMEIISITDHNSVKGIKGALEYGKNEDIKIISGIEIDCTYEDMNLHLLGYNIDYTKKWFYELEEDIFIQEMAAAEEKVDRIKKCTGLHLDKYEVFKRVNGKILTGEFIAQMLLENEDNRKNEMLKPYLEGGKRSEMPFVNFYWDFFSQGKPCYVPIKYLSLRETIDIIKESGGIPIIAHPANNLKGRLHAIDNIINEGVKGIEVFNTYHSIEETKYFYKKSKELGLFIACGSDFHGKNKPNIKIGEINCDDNNSVLKFIENLG